MKIRQGFVSNSSSSSFLIYGINVDSSDINETLEGLYLAKFPDEDIDEVESYEILEGLGFDEEFEYYDPGYNGDLYIGRSWSEVGNDETGKQFKDSVRNSLLKYFPEELVDDKIGTYAAAWHD